MPINPSAISSAVGPDEFGIGGMPAKGIVAQKAKIPPAVKGGKNKTTDVLGGKPAEPEKTSLMLMTRDEFMDFARTEQGKQLPVTAGTADANYVRPRYGTRIKPSQDIAAIYHRDLLRWEGEYEYKFITRNFSVQSISYQRADLHDAYVTFPSRVFAQFKAAAPLTVNFNCRVLNTNDFPWEQEWEQWRRGFAVPDPVLNPRWLVANGKILEIRVDGIVYLGYIVADAVNKTVELESGPTMQFSFLCLESRVAPNVVLQRTDALTATNNMMEYYTNADFRQFAVTYLTTLQYQGNIPPEYKEHWRDYVGWVQDSKDKAAKDSFWKKFLAGALDYLKDPTKAMHVIQEFSRSPEAGGKALGMTALGATEAGIVSGSQGTPYAGMVTSMTEGGMHRRLVSDMFRGDWSGALNSFSGLARSTGGSATSPFSSGAGGSGYKLVQGPNGTMTRTTKTDGGIAGLKKWGGATLGMGSWGTRKYFAAHPKSKNSPTTWGSGNK